MLVTPLSQPVGVEPSIRRHEPLVHQVMLLTGGGGGILQISCVSWGLQSVEQCTFFTYNAKPMSRTSMRTMRQTLMPTFENPGL